MPEQQLPRIGLDGEHIYDEQLAPCHVRRQQLDDAFERYDRHCEHADIKALLEKLVHLAHGPVRDTEIGCFSGIRRARRDHHVVVLDEGLREEAAEGAESDDAYPQSSGRHQPQYNSSSPKHDHTTIKHDHAKMVSMHLDLSSRRASSCRNKSCSRAFTSSNDSDDAAAPAAAEATLPRHFARAVCAEGGPSEKGGRLAEGNPLPAAAPRHDFAATAMLSRLLMPATTCTTPASLLRTTPPNSIPARKT
mmetsp:Transcript_61649/g.199679  ORF Transcript_61649/g.199679 Transcript_61649/m.199679 type:complete len:249 (-) Transcript_61649:146-892(-)